MKIRTLALPSAFRLMCMAFLASALFILPTSCNNQAGEEEAKELENTVVSAAAAEEAEAPMRYEFYFDNKQVKEGDFDPADPKLFVDVSGEPDPKVEGGGLIKIWAFSSEASYIAWGDIHGLPIACRLEMGRHLAEYAERSGAIQHAEKYGEVPKEYDEYVEKYIAKMGCSVEKTGERAFAVIYKDNSGGGSAKLFYTFKSKLWWSWNNEVSSYFTFGLFNAMTIYNGSFYTNRMATIWNWGWTTYSFPGTPLAWLNDRMTSGICL